MSECSDSTPGDLTIDCASCLARPAACGDCIVSVLLGPPGQIGGEEQAAFAVLNEKAAKAGIAILRTPNGFAMAPARAGKGKGSARRAEDALVS